MGSFAPTKGLQGQRPCDGTWPGHSMVTPEAEASNRPAASHEAATSGPRAAMPSNANCVRLGAALPASADRTTPRPCRDKATVLRPPSRSGPHASSLGSKSAGHWTSARTGARAPANTAGATAGAAGGVGSTAVANSSKYGSKLCNLSTTSSRAAASTPLSSESKPKPSSCKRRSTASSRRPTAGPRSAPPVPTSVGSEEPTFGLR
mmetsp:Transcript_25582/g.59531  ORF Transcript_25582/g.59531 Transcript_25582/m.59531 type:complete len:206 (+) Transcript_25582:449-1066(+)